MEIRYDGKRALVTGAGKGIGRAIAVALNNAGVVTHALSRTKEDLDSLKAEAPEIHTHQVELCDWHGTRRVVADVGPVDLLVNNAGVICAQAFTDITEEAVNSGFDTNVKAVINVTQVVVSGMIARGAGGSVVNISSTLSQRAQPGLTVYCATKAALDMLTKSMANELGPHQIRVNSVNPTGVRMTRMVEDFPDGERTRAAYVQRTPQRKLAVLDDVVHAVMYLLSDKADMVTGTTLPVDGGFWTG